MYALCSGFWLGPLVSLSVSRDLLGRLFVLSFHKAYPPPCVSNGFLDLSNIGIVKEDTSQIRRIVELRFIDGPSPLFLSLSFFLHTGPYLWPKINQIW